MNCPKCSTEMERGFLDHSHWVSGQKPWGELYFSITRRTAFVCAFKCPKCNIVELYAEETEKNKE